MATLYKHRDEFADRNPFLLVLLGLISCSREIESALRRLSSADAPPTAAPTSAQADPTLGFMLGLASVARTILDHAGAAAATTHTPTPAPIPAIRETDLRRLLE